MHFPERPESVLDYVGRGLRCGLQSCFLSASDEERSEWWREIGSWDDSCSMTRREHMWNVKCDTYGVHHAGGTQSRTSILRMSEIPTELEVGALLETKKLLWGCLLCSHGNWANLCVLVVGNWSRAMLFLWENSFKPNYVVWLGLQWDLTVLLTFSESLNSN